MEDITNWQAKFECCDYSDKLLNKLILLNNKVPYPVNINEITKAIYYAKKYYGSQMRQSGDPYYGSVASIIEDLLEATKLRFWTLCSH